MDNYTKIKTIVESGHIAQIYNSKNKKYYLCSAMRLNGDINISWGGSTLEEAYNYLGSFYTSKETIQNDFHHPEILIYKKPLWYPKVGDVVEILDTVKQSPGYGNWSDSNKGMIGGPFIVAELGEDCISVYSKEGLGCMTLDYRNIAPRIHGEKDESLPESLSGEEIKITIRGKEYEAIIK